MIPVLTIPGEIVCKKRDVIMSNQHVVCILKPDETEQSTEVIKVGW